MPTTRAHCLCGNRRSNESWFDAIKAVDTYSLPLSQRAYIAHWNVNCAKTGKLRTSKDSNIPNPKPVHLLNIGSDQNEARPFECLKPTQVEHSKSFTFARNFYRSRQNDGHEYT